MGAVAEEGGRRLSDYRTVWGGGQKAACLMSTPARAQDRQYHNDNRAAVSLHSPQRAPQRYCTSAAPRVYPVATV